MKKHKIPICRAIFRQYCFYAAVFTVFFVEFFYLGLYTYDTSFKLFLKFWLSITDTSLLILPLLFLKGRWRYLYIFIPLLLSPFIVANVLFFRHFHELIPASSYFSSISFNHFVVEDSLASATWLDYTILIFPFILLAFLLPSLRKYVVKSKVGKGGRIVTFLLFICSWSLNLAGNYRIFIVSQNRNLYDVTENLKMYFSIGNPVWFSWNQFYEHHGFVGYILLCCFTDIGKENSLNDADYDRIKKYIKKTSKYSKIESINCDSLVTSLHKNLIMIVVESWPYKTLEFDFSSQVMPEIISLLQEDRVIYKKAQKLTGVGNSSDAHLMYLTGLLPLKSEPFVVNYPLKDYPALAKAMKINSFEVIGESPKIWAHNLTTKSFGFQKLVSPKISFSNDSLVFENAKVEISKSPTPFFCFITTITMHGPYIDSDFKKRAHIPEALSDNERDMIYFERLRYFDNALSSFLNWLKSSGIYDDSIIVIVGDHPIEWEEVSEMLHDEYVPVIILNSSLRPYDDLKMSQIDLFPSLFDLMGIKEYIYDGENYRGFGRSIFDLSIQRGWDFPEEEAYEVSNLIIRGK